MQRVGDLTASELLGLVKRDIDRVAWRCLGRGAQGNLATGRMQDLRQEGHYELLRQQQLKADMPVDEFLNLCRRRIRGAMIDYLRAQDPVPRSTRVRARRIEKARQAIASRTGKNPTPGQLAEELDMTLEEVHDTIAQVYAESFIFFDDDSHDRDVDTLDFLASSIDTLDGLIAQERTDQLLRAIGELPEREQEIVTLRYFHDTPMVEIGRRMGVSSSRICQIHTRALQILRESLEAQLITG